VTLKMLINKFLKVNKHIKVAVLLRSESSDKKFLENILLKSIFNDLENNITYFGLQNDGKSYEVMANSKLIIGYMSTLTNEALGWGKKVIYYDTSKVKYAIPFYHEVIDINNKIFCTNSDFVDFNKKIKYLINLKQDQYIKYIKYIKNKIMIYDHNISSINNIILHLKKEISLKNTSY